MVTDDERRKVAAKLRCFDFLSAMRIGLARGSVSSGTLQVLGAIVGVDMTSPVECSRLFDRLADLMEPQPITGDTSDGYHTFDELYDHRAKLFSVIVRDHREIAWKSRLHHDGTMYDGMFIVGIETPRGQATYHYDVNPYWDLFDCKELDRAPEWDGHTPEQAIERIAALGPSFDLDTVQRVCFEGMESCDEPEWTLYTTINGAIVRYKRGESGPTYDRNALLALTYEMDLYTECDDCRCGKEMPPRVIHDFARRIREALGVTDDGQE